MIERNLIHPLRTLASLYPTVLVTGPRQSGKTTLCRFCFPSLRYVSLEPLDIRDHARRDPRGFLDEHREGAILDEVQHVPDLLSYLQVEVDERPEPRGRFILTGSQHFGLTDAVSQSLAGRVGVLNLMPCANDEVRRFSNCPKDLFETLWTGGYPAILDREIPAGRWLSDYVTTYVQRDVRQVLKVGDLDAFTTFVRLCAGRTGQVVNLSALGADCGISHSTARAWLSVLEASFLVFRLPPWSTNLTSQLVKTPKLHFWDAGLVCHLLGIGSPDQLRFHPLRGSIFESWVVSEVARHFLHRGLPLPLFFFRDQKGLEVDLVVAGAAGYTLVEIKSGQTFVSDWERALNRVEEMFGRKGGAGTIQRVVVYGGDEGRHGSRTRLLPWHEVAEGGW